MEKSNSKKNKSEWITYNKNILAELNFKFEEFIVEKIRIGDSSKFIKEATKSQCKFHEEGFQKGAKGNTMYLKPGMRVEEQRRSNSNWKNWKYQVKKSSAEKFYKNMLRARNENKTPSHEHMHKLDNLRNQLKKLKSTHNLIIDGKYRQNLIEKLENRNREKANQCFREVQDQIIKISQKYNPKN